MLSSIALEEFDEAKYRKFLHTLSDEALIKEGKKLPWFSGDGKIVSTRVCVFHQQLKICREEYRRRHSITPKSRDASR